ncbi:MAG: ATP-binding protein [Bacteroidaceae bacterium]|nr:ATP-binding protein [Bacteroidaceae bacterium]
MNNPFVTKGYAGAEYFCDRVKETQDLVQLLTNENNIALISPRRLGKTDLIYHCFHQPEIQRHYYTFVIDVYATGSLSDFVDVFGKAVLETLKPFGRKVWEQFLTTLRSLQQQISFDINGNPVWGVGLGSTVNPSVTLDEIFTYLNSADKPCIVAIDEFQQITQYLDGQNVEASLRTHIQRCQNATFLFAGSKRHLMGEIFTSPSRPFYQSVITMGLAPISVDKYTAFAAELFRKYGKTIDEKVVSDVYQRFDGVTSCLQRVMNVLYLRTPVGGHCSLDMVDDAIDFLLDLYTDNYTTLLSQMSERQRTVFRAIAMEGKAENVTSGQFIRKYHLWSASSVSSALRGLLEKDFLTSENGIYSIYDHFFSLWMVRISSSHS